MVRAAVRRAGSSGQAAAVGLSWDWWRRRDNGGAFAVAPSNYDDHTSTAPLQGTPVYPWGFAGGNFTTAAGISNMGAGTWANTFLGGTLVDFYLAIPQMLPAGKITRLIASQQGGAGAVAGARVRMQIWENRGTSDAYHTYPATRIYDSGEVDFETPGAKNTGEISVVTTGGLYWATLQPNPTTVSNVIRGGTLRCDLCYSVGGMTVRWGNGEPNYNRSLLIAWRHAQAYGAPPSTFPSASPVKIGFPDTPSLSFLPLIMYGFQPS